MTHPSFKRMQDVAAGLGSTATTARGIAKFLRGDKRAGAAIRAAVCPVGGSLGNTATGRKRATWQNSPGVLARKSDPGAKRARDDKRFRKSYLARLRKWEAIRRTFDGSTLGGVMAYIDSRAARVNYLAEFARLRSIATGKPVKPLDLPTLDLPTVPIDEPTARKLGADVNMRGKDAILAPTIRASYGVHEDAYTVWDKKGRPRGQRAVHKNFVRSFGLIVNPSRLEAVFHKTQVAVALPDGYIWERDANGLRAVDASSRRDDYHPDAAELLRKDAAAYLVQKISSNRARRADMAARVAVEAAAVKGVYVCLADSIRAGNCRAGTLAFGQRHGLDPARHYTAPELLEIANGDGSRVRLAVTAARLRHEREEKRGFCELSEHRA